MKKEEVNHYITLCRDDADIFLGVDDVSVGAGEWGKYFGNSNPICLEIGTGMGNFFSEECSHHPEKNYIGMDIRYKRVYNAAEKSRQKGASNFAIIKEFAQEIGDVFAEGELSEVYVFFPDPWARKKKQLKNRLFQREFLDLLARCLKSGGKLIYKTDHEEYFRSTLDLFREHEAFDITVESYDYEKELDVFDKQNMTEFEHMFRSEQGNIHYTQIVRK
ncbi:tRNA (guanosine(46)-N7)-methyltransferase TrmB [Candidatus Gracilibacteria bacterium]|nr:tRNA (guanosine(46)-N7)-methyltransferase TrmB [Candidatus Gracilibacteria bacterium]